MQRKQQVADMIRNYRTCLKHALETCKQAPTTPERREWMLTFHCTQIVQSILDQLLKFGDVNQQTNMLAMLLYHKLLFAFRLDHC